MVLPLVFLGGLRWLGLGATGGLDLVGCLDDWFGLWCDATFCFVFGLIWWIRRVWWFSGFGLFD